MAPVVVLLLRELRQLTENGPDLREAGNPFSYHAGLFRRWTTLPNDE